MVFVFRKDVIVFVFHVLQSATRIIGVGEEPHERIRAGAGEFLILCFFDRIVNFLKTNPYIHF
ncbi:hypothetical protein [Flavobacterium sp.]|uniref:hypothetical protein n=1 Tax=Flavobacterium sp. TaxID=239 RepID=UPI0037C13D8A